MYVSTRKMEFSLYNILVTGIYSVVAAHSVRHVRAAHDCMRQQAIIPPHSRLTASLSAVERQKGGAHCAPLQGRLNRYGYRLYSANAL